MNRLAWLNALDAESAVVELRKCCGSSIWAEQMNAARPFTELETMMGTADSIWWALSREDWLEAFSAHPRIGSQRDVAKKSGEERSWSEKEQAGASAASQSTLDALAEANAAYEARFGHIYLVCATGKTADELLTFCRSRLANDPETELRIAAEEQRKIMRLRLGKLLEEPKLVSTKAATKETNTVGSGTGKITTHVLDTARGKPARGVPIVLALRQASEWREIARGKTDDDGRLKTLIAEGTTLDAGTYKLVFDVAAYEEGFFPEVTIAFRVDDPTQHFHVPLLLSPFGYSTYRGS